MNEPYAGNSGTHKPRGTAVETTNGAGSHNIQMFVMNPDGTVLHCLPGYWNPHDLNAELQLGLKLNSLYANPSISMSEKVVQFRRLQTEHVREHSDETHARSKLQGFDMRHEASKPKSDFVKDRSYLSEGEHWGPDSHLAFKTTDQVMHERMSNRPFQQYEKFDVASFCDYGQHTYDKHEDTLGEPSNAVAQEKAHFVPIKTASAMAAARSPLKGQRHGSGNIARKTYVHTYGVARRTCLPSAHPESP